MVGAAGAVLFASLFLEWVNGGGESANAWNTPEAVWGDPTAGAVVTVAWALVGLLGILAAVWGPRGGRPWFVVLALAALAAFVFVVLYAVTVRDEFTDLSVGIGVILAGAAALVEAVAAWFAGRALAIAAPSHGSDPRGERE